MARIREGQHHNVAFGDVRRLLEALGFELDRIRGSHHVFVHPALRLRIPLQPERGRAKPYQLRQLLRLIQSYNLRLEEGP